MVGAPRNSAIAASAATDDEDPFDGRSAAASIAAVAWSVTVPASAPRTLAVRSIAVNGRSIQVKGESQRHEWVVRVGGRAGGTPGDAAQRTGSGAGDDVRLAARGAAVVGAGARQHKAARSPVE